MKEKYYITASVKREPTKQEKVEIGITGASVFSGRIKAVIESETWQAAMELGKECINGCLKSGYTAFNFGWMPVSWVEKVGDEGIYEKYNTATWLCYYRGRKGLTQKALAEQSGVNIRQIQKIEAGEIVAGNVSARNILALADALEVDPHDLIR